MKYLKLILISSLFIGLSAHASDKKVTAEIMGLKILEYPTAQVDFILSCGLSFSHIIETKLLYDRSERVQPIDIRVVLNKRNIRCVHENRRVVRKQFELKFKKKRSPVVLIAHQPRDISLPVPGLPTQGADIEINLNAHISAVLTSKGYLDIIEEQMESLDARLVITNIKLKNRRSRGGDGKSVYIYLSSERIMRRGRRELKPLGVIVARTYRDTMRGAIPTVGKIEMKKDVVIAGMSKDLPISGALSAVLLSSDFLNYLDQQTNNRSKLKLVINRLRIRSSIREPMQKTIYLDLVKRSRHQERTLGFIKARVSVPIGGSWQLESYELIRPLGL